MRRLADESGETVNLMVRTPEGERAGFSTVSADCVVSQSPEMDCPDLGN